MVHGIAVCRGDRRHVGEWNTVDGFVVLVCFELTLDSRLCFELFLLGSIREADLQGRSFVTLPNDSIVEGLNDHFADFGTLESVDHQSSHGCEEWR